MNKVKINADFFEPNFRLKVKKEVDVNQVDKVLVQGIDQLGGLAQSTPFFRELRRLFPNAYIVNLVGALTFGVMKNCPYVDDVWLFNKKQSLKMARKIKLEKFDLTFLASGTLRAALLAYLGRIPNRVGYDNDGTAKLLTVQLHQPLSSRYRPENMFDMLRAIGLSPQGVYEREFWISSSDIDYAEQWRINWQSAESILAFNPFSTDPKRRWTDDAWIRFLQYLPERAIKPIMMVAPNEVTLAQKLLAKWSLDLPIEAHTVTQTAAILNKIDFVLGPESGFIHMALAVNHPHVIALFNVLPPVSTFPIHDKNHIGLINHQLPCCPCYLYKFKDRCPNNLECMSEISAEQVIEALDQLIEIKKTHQKER